MPWSGWFNKQAKKRRKVEPWVMATISLEEEFEVEKVLREVFNYIDPDDIPDLISAFLSFPSGIPNPHSAFITR